MPCAIHDLAWFLAGCMVGAPLGVLAVCLCLAAQRGRVEESAAAGRVGRRTLQVLP